MDIGKLNVDGVRVFFHHVHNGQKNAQQNKKRYGSTTCFIVQKDDENNKVVLASGKSECSLDDQFVKRIGVVKSFGKAMKELSQVNSELHEKILVEVNRMRKEWKNGKRTTEQSADTTGE